LSWLSPIVNLSLPIDELEPMVKVVPSNVKPDSPLIVEESTDVITLLLPELV
jgi:hypothetical protein